MIATSKLPIFSTISRMSFLLRPVGPVVPERVSSRYRAGFEVGFKALAPLARPQDARLDDTLF